MGGHSSQLLGSLVRLTQLTRADAEAPPPPPPATLRASGKGLIDCLLKGAPIVNTMKLDTPSSGSASGIYKWLITILEGTIHCSEEKVKKVECTHQNMLHPSTLVEMSIHTVRGFFSTGLHHSCAGMVVRDSWEDSRLSRLRKKFLFAH